MEFGSNTTEKFQNSLKNFKTHEAQSSEFSNFSVSFEIFPWCLKAKFQIPPLRRRMFVINTTTILLQVPRYVSVQCTPFPYSQLAMERGKYRRNQICISFWSKFTFTTNISGFFRHFRLYDKHFSYFHGVTGKAGISSPTWILWPAEWLG